MAWNDRASRRWQERQTDARHTATQAIVITEQVIVGATEQAVWRAVHDPATSVLVQDNISRGFTIPGTPVGEVGEQQCYITEQANGTIVGDIIEVVEITDLNPGRRVVTESRSYPTSITTATIVIPLEQGGCVLRLRTEMSVSPDSAQAATEEFTAAWRRYLSRIKDLCEAKTG